MESYERQLLPNGKTIELGNTVFTIMRNVGVGGSGLTYLASYTENESAIEKYCILKELFSQELFEAGFICRNKEGIVTIAKAVDDDTKSLLIKEINRKAKREYEIASRAKYGSSEGTNIEARFFDVRYEKYKKNDQNNISIFLIMDTVDGCSFKELINDDRLGLKERFEILKKAYSVVGELHIRGILHLDLKPDNFYYTKSGEVILLDFGSAIYIKELSGDINELTVSFSEGYSAPEERRLFDSISYYNSLPSWHPDVHRYEGIINNQKKDIGPWTDIYAVTAILYTLLSGELINSQNKHILINNIIDNLNDAELGEEFYRGLYDYFQIYLSSDINARVNMEKSIASRMDKFIALSPEKKRFANDLFSIGDAVFYFIEKYREKRGARLFCEQEIKAIKKLLLENSLEEDVITLYAREMSFVCDDHIIDWIDEYMNRLARVGKAYPNNTRQCMGIFALFDISCERINTIKEHEVDGPAIIYYSAIAGDINWETDLADELLSRIYEMDPSEFQKLEMWINPLLYSSSNVIYALRNYIVNRLRVDGISPADYEGLFKHSIDAIYREVRKMKISGLFSNVEAILRYTAKIGSYLEKRIETDSLSLEDISIRIKRDNIMLVLEHEHFGKSKYNVNLSDIQDEIESLIFRDLSDLYYEYQIDYYYYNENEDISIEEMSLLKEYADRVNYSVYYFYMHRRLLKNSEVLKTADRESFEYLIKAANAGHIFAMSKIGLAYWYRDAWIYDEESNRWRKNQGNELSKDWDEHTEDDKICVNSAMYWLQKASDGGDADACFLLGQFAKDDDEKKMFYEKAINLGEPNAMFFMALSGHYDTKESIECLRNCIKTSESRLVTDLWANSREKWSVVTKGKNKNYPYVKNVYWLIATELEKLEDTPYVQEYLYLKRSLDVKSCNDMMGLLFMNRNFLCFNEEKAKAYFERGEGALKVVNHKVVINQNS